ncbi:LysM domain-containing protein [Brevibacterium sanguinis]|uniref:LysM domain-containing protein n=2 Tax=Brevibacterium TaxID=1696 RepID=A0A366IFN1_9MICO|nr:MULTISPECIES: LysM peptidoglycan-binding domain-containing protein [Brevibacterium]RBP61914.1 LysM domain-containing protein [Brevibacterium sanguinis]RBP68640.1 LysM domain-containing protein [Brevibacterium celere]
MPITAAPDIRAASRVNSTGPIPGLDDGPVHRDDSDTGTADTGTAGPHAVGPDAASDSDPHTTDLGTADPVASGAAEASPAHARTGTGHRRAAGQSAGPSWISGTASEPVPVTHGGRTYKVKQGDTLYAVASRHGVSVPALAELNRISPRQNLQQGQVLSLPEKNELPDTDPSHVVARGETLAGIAARHGVSPGALRRANSMGESSFITVGELLLLRDSTARRHRPQVSAPADLPRLATSAQTHDVAPEVLHAARLNKRTLLGRRHPAPAQARLLVARIAEDLGAEPELMQAVAAQESGFQHTTVSPGNAIGIMQVTPRSGRWASDIAGRPLDLLDIADNIVAGTVILGWLIETAESETEALAGYYQDLRSVRADGVLPETKAFVRAVQLQRQRLKEAL